MSEMQTPETKESKNPEVQAWVKRQKSYLQKKYPQADLVHLNQHARDRVAARIKLEKRAREAQKARKESETDSLTGLLNSSGFKTQIEQETKRMQRTRSKSTLVILDVNDLKKTNDTLGHDAGDQLLKNTAEALRQGSRSIDIIARAGEKADEFRVLLLDTDLEGVEIWWNRVNEFFEEKDVKIAAGTTELDPNDAEKSTKKADQAMYMAKQNSKQIGENLMLRFDQLNT